MCSGRTNPEGQCGNVLIINVIFYYIKLSLLYITILNYNIVYLFSSFQLPGSKHFTDTWPQNTPLAYSNHLFKEKRIDLLVNVTIREEII